MVLVLHLDNIAFLRGIEKVYLGDGEVCGVSDAIVYCLAYMGYRVGGIDLYTSCVSEDNGRSLGLVMHYTGGVHTIDVGGVRYLDVWSLGIFSDCLFYVDNGELWIHVDSDFVKFENQTYFYTCGSGMVIYDFGDVVEFSDNFVKRMLYWCSGVRGIYFSGSGFINACLGFILWGRDDWSGYAGDGVFDEVLESIGMLQARGLWVWGTIREEILKGLPAEVLRRLRLMGAI